MTWPESEVLVEFDGLVLDGSLDGDFKLEELDGWEELPGARERSVDRPNQHGSFDDPIFSTRRRVTAAGWCVDIDSRDTLLRAFRRATTFGALRELRVTVAGQTLRTMARVKRSRPVIGSLWPAGAFPWAVEWSCPDPYRYGPVQVQATTLPVESGGLEFDLFTDGDGNDVGWLDFGDTAGSGRVTVTNAGNATGSPLMRIAGPVERPWVVQVETGRILQFWGYVPAGSELVLDSGAGVAALDGSSRTADMNHRDWFSVPPEGASTFAFFAPQPYPGAVLTVESADTWW